MSEPELRNGNGEVVEFSVGSGGEELTKKLGKSKGKKLKKLSKSRKLAKSGKNLSKSGNSTNFGTIETGPNFLTPKARAAINSLWLAFTKAPILWHFDPECHIWIETDASGYTIDEVLNQLTSKTSLNEVVTKANLGQWHPVAFFSKKMIPL